MNDDVKAFLDGELPLEALSAEDRAAAEMWARALEELRGTGAETAPPWLEDAIMADVAQATPPRRAPWLVRPVTVRLTPLGGLLAAAAVAFLLLIPRFGGTPGPAEDGTAVYVQFVLEAPGARSVAVAGDFSGWQDRYSLEDVDGDGVWTGRIPLVPGIHQYMFVIDGVDWVTDPHAQHYADDGFGNRNAVIAVDPAVQASNS